jgi:hypothetical protein
MRLGTQNEEAIAGEYWQLLDGNHQEGGIVYRYLVLTVE